MRKDSSARILLLLGLVGTILGGCLSGRLREPRITVWATGDSLQVFPDTPYQDGNHHWNGPKGSVSLSGAANEWVAFQLVLRSDMTAKNIGVEIGGLTAGEGRIGQGNIHLYREHYVRVKKSTPRHGSTGPGDYPDPLIPFFNPYGEAGEQLALPLTLERNRNLPVWVDIFIPPKTPPGEYAGTIRITLRGETVKELALRLKVWDFELPAGKTLKVFFDLYSFRWSRGEGLPFSLNDRTWEVLSRYEIMAREHGFSNGHWDLMPDNITADGPVDWTLYDRYLGTVLDGSLFEDGQPPSCWELPFPENWKPGETVLRNYTREVVRHWEEKGWDLDSAFAYIWDEKGPTHPDVLEYGKIIREASEGKINYFYTHGPHPDLYGLVDWWAPRASQYYPEKMRERQELGEKGFFYHGDEPSVGLMCLDAIGLAFRTWSWVAWKYRVDGFFGWAANFWGKEPYLDPVSIHDNNGNLYVYYPGAQLPSIGYPAVKGPIPSFRIKMVRRGIQDYEYFRLARQKGLNPDPLVDSIVRRGLGETGAYGIDPGAWSRFPEEWYRVRDVLGEMIDARGHQ
jgi:hypothetical protein